MKLENTYIPGLPNLGGATGHLMAVLTADDGVELRNTSVYVAIVKVDPCNERARLEVGERVALTGAKQTYRQALAYFPQLREEDYRV